MTNEKTGSPPAQVSQTRPLRPATHVCYTRGMTTRTRLVLIRLATGILAIAAFVVWPGYAAILVLLAGAGAVVGLVGAALSHGRHGRQHGRPPRRG